MINPSYIKILDLGLLGHTIYSLINILGLISPDSVI